jgi:hypothetical protein
VKEYQSKQEAREEIARKFEERDDFNENGINSLEELVYGGSTDEDSDPNGLDTNRTPTVVSFTREQL